MGRKKEIRPVPVLEGDVFLERQLPGTSHQIVELRRRIATLNSPRNQRLVQNVLITGESGAGKNHVARVLAAHKQWLLAGQHGADGGVVDPLSIYADGRFIEVSLPGLSDELVESELFGHRKGAFTNALNDHAGYFGEGYSDILLDEVGDASPRLQAKLLRVLNSGEFRPVGGTRDDERRTEARILMATHQPLAELARTGRFRSDLLWRMREFVLYVPALREQKENLRTLAHKIIDDLQAEVLTGPHGKLTLDEADLTFIESCRWPGNVRELRHTLTRWLIHAGTTPVEVIMRECEQEHASMRRDSTETGLETAVSEILDRARTERTVVAPTVGEFVDSYSVRVRRAVATWLDRTRPGPKELETMFPASSGANAIRTTIGKWRVP